MSSASTRGGNRARWRSSKLRPVPARFAALCCALLICTGPLAGSSPAQAGRGLRGLSALQDAVARVESLVVGAHFRKAERLAEETREWADDIPRSSGAKQQRARLEVLLCTAQVALGNKSAARRSMGRAVYVWPLLRLDESTTSPRVVRLFRELRGGGKKASR